MPATTEGLRYQIYNVAKNIFTPPIKMFDACTEGTDVYCVRRIKMRIILQKCCHNKLLLVRHKKILSGSYLIYWINYIHSNHYLYLYSKNKTSLQVLWGCSCCTWNLKLDLLHHVFFKKKFGFLNCVNFLPKYDKNYCTSMIWKEWYEC